MAIVYLHKRKDNNEVFYIGIGKNEKRAYTKHKRTEYWQKITSKYGYFVEITHNSLIWEEACCIEKYLINFWRDNSASEICNFTDGGEGTLGFSLSENSRKKLSDTQKLRLSNKEKHGMYGKKHTKESIEKNRNSNKGSNSILLGKLGNLHPRFGRKISEEQKKIIAISNKKRAKIDDFIAEKLVLEYIPKKVSLSTLSKKYGVSISTISKVIIKKKNEIYNRRQANCSKVSLEGMG